MLLDFWKGAQRVSPVCVGVFLGSARQGARASRPVFTRPRRPCPLSFALQSPISKGQWYKGDETLLASRECAHDNVILPPSAGIRTERFLICDSGIDPLDNDSTGDDLKRMLFVGS